MIPISRESLSVQSDVSSFGPGTEAQRRRFNEEEKDSWSLARFIATLRGSQTTDFGIVPARCNRTGAVCGVWWCGGVVVWWCGGVVVWWCGGVVVWWCGGGVVVWWCGGVVVWWCGGVVVWWCGGVVLWWCGGCGCGFGCGGGGGVQLIMWSHVPEDMTPLAVCLCTRP